jgi:hypothetical protein
MVSSSLCLVLCPLCVPHSSIHNGFSIRPALNEYTTSTENVTFVLQGAFSSVTSLNVWFTQFGWDGMQQTESTFFQQQKPITVTNGQFTVTVGVDQIWSITTLNSVQRANISTPPPSQPFPSQYSDNFEAYPVESEAQYFADQAGMQLLAFVVFCRLLIIQVMNRRVRDLRNQHILRQRHATSRSCLAHLLGRRFRAIFGHWKREME